MGAGNIKRDQAASVDEFPLGILHAARQAVPAVDYALGAAGVAAAGAVITGLLGNGRAAIIILGGTLIAMLLLFGFARLVAAQSSSATLAGVVLLWAVIGFFCTFLIFTITAVAFRWPPAWAATLGFDAPAARPNSSAEWSLENCKADFDDAFRAFLLDRSNVSRASKLIDCKNPYGYSLLGQEAFYRTAYEEAERYFTWAVKELPHNTSKETRNQYMDNLASSQIETGRYLNAIQTYRELVDSTASDAYRWDLGKAYIYQGQNDPGTYQRALEVLRGVNPSFVGKVANGRVQVLLAAAHAGQALRSDTSIDERQNARKQAHRELCKGILKDENFWRSVLKRTTPYPNASFKEEIRLLEAIGGGTIPCPPPLEG
jgi:tetratricopeptide (TPR) repeat protein